MILVKVVFLVNLYQRYEDLTFSPTILVSKQTLIRPGKFKKILTSSQPAVTCSKLTIETLVQGVKFVQS